MLQTAAIVARRKFASRLLDLLLVGGCEPGLGNGGAVGDKGRGRVG